MKNRLPCLLVASASLLGHLTVAAEVHPDSSAWVELFAHDFSNAENTGGVWSWEENVLTASEDKPLWTLAPYGDYVLDLEFKTAPGSNSGVIIHCSDKGNWIPNSVEVQIADDTAKQWAESPKTWQCAAIFGHLAASESRVKKPGEWNRYTITCKENQITVALNGKEVTRMDMAQWTSAKTNPDGSEIPGWLSKPVAELAPRGYIGLQGKHAGAPIWFRNIRIQALAK